VAEHEQHDEERGEPPPRGPATEKPDHGSRGYVPVHLLSSNAGPAIKLLGEHPGLLAQLPAGSPIWKPSFASCSRRYWNRWY
jgi:hypothetical protein